MTSRAKQLLIFAVALLVGGGLFAYLVWRTGPQAIIASLETFGIPAFVGFVVLSLANFGLYSLRWQIILNDMLPPGKGLPWWKVYLHRMSGYAAGYLTPASQVASEPVRVAMLRSDGVPYKEATSSVILDLAFEIAAYIVFVISGVVLAVATGLDGGSALVGAEIFVGVLIALMVIFFWTIAAGHGFFSAIMRMARVHKRPRFANSYAWIVEMEGMMTKFFRNKRWTIAGIVSMSLFMVSFRAIEATYIAHFFGVALTMRDAFLLAALPGVVLLLPVPGGLGLYEGTNAATFALLGLALNPIAFTGIIRLRDFLFIGIGVIHAVRQGESLWQQRKL